jgi:hypothetical protein
MPMWTSQTLVVMYECVQESDTTTKTKTSAKLELQSTMYSLFKTRILFLKNLVEPVSPHFSLK